MISVFSKGRREWVVFLFRVIIGRYLPFAGWNVMVNTPLFGFQIQRRFPAWNRQGFVDIESFSFWPRGWQDEGGVLYRWQWQRERNFVSLEEHYERTHVHSSH